MCVTQLKSCSTASGDVEGSPNSGQAVSQRRVPPVCGESSTLEDGRAGCWMKGFGQSLQNSTELGGVRQAHAHLKLAMPQATWPICLGEARTLTRVSRGPLSAPCPPCDRSGPPGSTSDLWLVGAACTFE